MKLTLPGRDPIFRFAFLLFATAVALLGSRPTAPGAPFTFSNTGSLNAARFAHTTTVLSNGQVLVAGGVNAQYLKSVELYDPAKGTWTSTGSLAVARHQHTATLLRNGRVLVVGGGNDSGSLASAELYDPASGTWTATGSLGTARGAHTATLLSNGKVLVAGGVDASGSLASAELYDPASGTWTFTGSLSASRTFHTATLLRNDKVLVAGGADANGSLASAELYDPASGVWTATASLGTGSFRPGRVGHTATLLSSGKVLVAAGSQIVFGVQTISSAELYDPASGTWAGTGNLSTDRDGHTATLLPSGKLLVAAGRDRLGGFTYASAELYDPASGTWTATGSLAGARYEHTATLLPSGRVLIVGGCDGSGNALAIAELYDAASGTWAATGPLGAPRSNPTATLLPNGRVLVTGGSNSGSISSAELYDPASGSWTATGSLAVARSAHTTTLLPNGKVLVAGGYDGTRLGSAELYDAASGAWTATASLNSARANHTATLLSNGKVLVAGATDSGGVPTSAELYDPESGTWAATGGLGNNRLAHTATLLPSGKVLVAGGAGPGGILATAELYDPASGTWSPTANLLTARYISTATLLPSGKVLVAGGFDGSNTSLGSAELYDPASGSWTFTGNLIVARGQQTMTLLPDGTVLVAGGGNGGGALATAEIYEPASGTWTATGSLGITRSSHTATLLPSGKVLVAGGFTGIATVTNAAELYDIGLGFIRPDWQPQIATATATLRLGDKLALTGSRFQGVSQASGGGFQDSASNYPIVQLRSLDNSQVAFLPVDPAASWSDTAFTSIPVNGFPFGPALVTVFTNGIPSAAKYLLVAPVSLLGNISTRLRVETGDNVLIGGFIVTGTQPKKVIIRAIGPSLASFFPGTLADPTLELRDAAGGLIMSNNNWRDDPAQMAEILATAIQPSNDLESAIVATLPANNSAYTAIVRGVNNGTGIGIVEAYDLDRTVNSKLANISTRGFVQTGDNVLIAGTIVLGQPPQRVLVRAIGPSLAFPGKLEDPTLELRDANGGVVRANDNWRTGGQEGEIIATGIPPSNEFESAVVAILPANNASYTAIVRGVGATTGIAVVEVYALQ